MAISLYDLSVTSFRRFSAASRAFAKGLLIAREGIDPNEIVETRLS